MKAAIITKPGGPEVLEVRDVPQPEPAADQVLVRVRASALNRADLLQRRGKYPAPPGASQEIPGIEFAGEVSAVGPDARAWQVGQRVFGIVGGGAHAEYIVVHERAIAEVPESLGWEQAAAIPEAFITAHDALWVRAGLRPNEKVLIHAVGSGVGLAAVQLVRAMEAVPFGTSRTPDKIERARMLGLENGLAASENLDALADAAREWTGGEGFDVVLDLVGGPAVAASVRVLGLKGRLLLVGSPGGSRAELDLGQVLGKRLSIFGTVLRSRPLEEKIDATRRFAAEVVPLIGRGVLRPNVDNIFPLSDIQSAHALLESNKTFGKIVVTID
jgi:NADPH:quinone reductase